MKALVIGCGRVGSSIALQLAREGWDVTAVDFSQVGRDKGRDLAGGLEVEWVCADATTWESPPVYDLCLIASQSVSYCDGT